MRLVSSGFSCDADRPLEEDTCVVVLFEPRHDLGEMWEQGSLVVVPLDSEEGRRLQEILEREPEDRVPGAQPGATTRRGLRRVRQASGKTADDQALQGSRGAGWQLPMPGEEQFQNEIPAGDGVESDPPLPTPRKGLNCRCARVDHPVCPA